MFLEDLRALLSESIARFALDQFVDKVGGLSSPTTGDLLLMDFYLFRQNMIANLLSILAIVRPLAKHALVGDHTHCKVVDSDSVVLATHDFRSHIARRT